MFYFKQDLHDERAHVTLKIKIIKTIKKRTAVFDLMETKKDEKGRLFSSSVLLGGCVF